MPYALQYLPAAERAIERLPRQMGTRVTTRLAALAENPRPHGSEKLAGRDEYRVRVGDFRIIYAIRDAQLIVLVIDVGNRRDVYRRR